MKSSLDPIGLALKILAALFEPIPGIEDNAALRFASAKELVSMPQVGRTYGRMKTLFIDEGDLESLDTETKRDLFVQKLFDTGEFFDKTILITHLVEVADNFQGQIRINMTPEQESRIEVVR